MEQGPFGGPSSFSGPCKNVSGSLPNLCFFALTALLGRGKSRQKQQGKPMRSILKPVFLAALLIQSGNAFAQEATEETPQDEVTEPAPAEAIEDTPADSGLSLGEPVGPQPGEPYVREEFGDWALRCIKGQEGETDPCSLYQLLSNQDGVAVSEFNIFPLPPGGRAAAGATVVVPLETLLSEQLTIAVDGASARRYPFTFCNRAGCIARLGFTAEDVAQFKRGASATVRIVPAATPDVEFVLDLSLSGFTAGFDAVGFPGE